MLANAPLAGRMRCACILCLCLGISLLGSLAQVEGEKASADTVYESEDVEKDSDATGPEDSKSKDRSPAAGRPGFQAYEDKVQQGVGSASGLSNDTSGPNDDGPGLWGMFSQVLVFLILLTSLAYAFIHYAKKGKINLGALKAYSADNRLIVSESRMLGNRQYLMVVEYGAQKMLLAVSPGRIEHLCYLDSAYEEDLANAMEEEMGNDQQV